jgi:hypothetical protein
LMLHAAKTAVMESMVLVMPLCWNHSSKAGEIASARTKDFARRRSTVRLSSIAFVRHQCQFGKSKAGMTAFR